MSASVADLAVWTPGAGARIGPLPRDTLNAIWARREEWSRVPTRACPVAAVQAPLYPAHRWGAWEWRKTPDGKVAECQCAMCGQIQRQWAEDKEASHAAQDAPAAEDATAPAGDGILHPDPIFCAPLPAAAGKAPGAPA